MIHFCNFIFNLAIIFNLLTEIQWFVWAHARLRKEYYTMFSFFSFFFWVKISWYTIKSSSILIASTAETQSLVVATNFYTKGFIHLWTVGMERSWRILVIWQDKSIPLAYFFFQITYFFIISKMSSLAFDLFPLYIKELETSIKWCDWA